MSSRSYLLKFSVPGTVLLFMLSMTGWTQTTQPSQPPQTAPQTTPASGNAPAATPQTQSKPDIGGAPADEPATAEPDAVPASAAPDTGVLPTSTSKSYPHDGGEDDVNAIGNRKGVGGRGLGDWYSYEKEIAMGKAYAQQVETTVKLINDPVITEYVNRVGQNLVRNSDAKVPFTIKVIDDDSINAFALPGGFFYVNSGLILAADNESEMAGVMAHEIAHVCARHAMRQMTRSNWANIMTLPLIFVGGGIGYAAQLGASLALPVTFMKFSRNFEAEADYLGIQYAYKAGYDPQGLIQMFEKTEALEKKKPGTLAKAFDSHPQTPDRVSASEKEIAGILPPRESYIVNTSEFDDVKARLAALENRRKLKEVKDESRPSLRRNTTDNTQGNTQNKDDGRPTLKRRDDSNPDNL